MKVAEFVLAEVPEGARVLEVGCGSGELAKVLAERGLDVTAIDPEAPDGPIFRRVSLEEFRDPRSFDAVVAQRSLHHVHNLEGGLDQINALLQPTGVLILDEFAWDRMDEATAAWYAMRSGDALSEDDTLHPDNFPGAWITEHEGMHGIGALQDALRGRFKTESLEWVPFIAPYYLEREDLVPEESRLIQAGEIQAVGFRYVGTPMRRSY